MGVILQQSGGGGGGALPSGTQNQVLATPNGSSGIAALRALVAADIPNIAESQVTNLTTDLAAKVPTTTTVNGHALSSNVVVSASDITTGTLPHAQLPALVAGDIPNIAESQVTSLVSDLAATEKTANKAAANGYAGLDANGKLSLTELPDSGQTAGNGAYMWTMDAGDGDIGGTTTIISPTGANNVLVWKFVCRKTITIRKVVFMNGATVTAAATASFGIYDNSGNLLLDSGAFSTAVASQTLSNTLGAAVTLYNNTNYYFAQACTNATNNAAGNGPSTLAGTVVPTSRNKNVTRQGTAANAYNGTSLPATLGVVSAFANRTPVPVMFES